MGILKAYKLPDCQHNKKLRYLAEARAFGWQVLGIWNNIPGLFTPQHPENIGANSWQSPGAVGFNKSTVHNVSSAFGHQLNCRLFFSSLPHQAVTPRQGFASRAPQIIICRTCPRCGPFAVAAQHDLFLPRVPAAACRHLLPR